MAISARQIEIFRMVMLLGSAKRAAAALHITQPAVTQLLAQLESESGLKLFDRLKGRLVPTPEAHALLAEVERVYVGLDMVQRKIELLRAHEDAVLRVGTLHAMSASVMPAVVAEYLRHYPRMRCQLMVDSSLALRASLLQGELDLAFMGDEADTSGLVASTFYEAAAVCVMPVTHPLARRAQVRPEDLHDAPLIALAAWDPAQRRLQQLFDQAGIAARFVVETPYSATQCALVLAGAGLAITNPLVAREYLPLGLRAVPFAPALHFRAVLAFHPGQGQSSAAQRFVALCRQRVGQTLAV